MRACGPETDVQIGGDGVYRYEGPETDVQTGRDGVYRYEVPETDVQTLRLPSYAITPLPT